MDRKKYQPDGEGEGRCIQFLMCCNAPASTGVKLVSVFSILFGLVYCCLGVWMNIVMSRNDDLPIKNQVYYETWSVNVVEPISSADLDEYQLQSNPQILSSKKNVPLASFDNYLIALGVLSLAVGFVRVLSSIFLLWNSVEKHSRLPGKVWIFFTVTETLTIVTFLLVALNVTGFINDTPWSPVQIKNDKFSFYILITIFRIICLSDIFLVTYFVFIVLWFVRTRA